MDEVERLDTRTQADTNVRSKTLDFVVEPFLEQLDNYAEAYTDEFPYFKENLMTHTAYGGQIAKYIRSNNVKSAMSLGIGHAEVTRCILAELINGPLNRYVVVDGAPQIIEHLRRSLGTTPPEGLEIIEGYFETFVARDHFEVIEAGFILEHVDDPAFLLRRLHQFLERRGRLFITVPNARSLHRLLGHEAGLLDDMYVLSESDLALGHKRYFDLNSITALVEDAGFKVAKVEGLFLKPFTTGQLNKLNLSPAVWQALVHISADYPAISNAIYIEAIA